MIKKLPILTTVAFLLSFFLASSVFAEKPGKRGKKGGIELWRFGGGYGNSFYLTNQMDYAITRNFGEFEEVRPTYFGAAYKKLNSSMELGLNFRHGSMQTLKSENTQGTQCDFDDAQVTFGYSFNNNIGLEDKRYTINGQIALGGILFKSMYFTVDEDLQRIRKYYSTVGYQGELSSSKDQENKQLAVVGNFGITLGFRLLNNVSIYWENNVNISTSNKMSGNLHKQSWIPPDGYFFTGVGLFINITPARGKISCPRFY